jgi:SAM-dependent methyltransferase
MRAREWLHWSKQHQPSPWPAWSAAVAGLVGVVLAALGVSRAGYSATCPDDNVPARVIPRSFDDRYGVGKSVQLGTVPSPPRVLRDWRTKALLQRGLSMLPGDGRALNYRLQRLTHGLPVSAERLAGTVEKCREHLHTFGEHSSRPLHEATFFEFGAGWDLRAPIALFSLGVEHQVVVDLHPLARPDLVDDILSRIGRLEAFSGDALERLDLAATRARCEMTAAAKVRHFGVEYRAPCDAAHTGLADGSIDCVTSISTLEHIPADDIVAIMRECRRLLSPDGIASFFIDYSDHAVTFDPTVTAYNFLRYSDRRWRIYNSAISYQNRLQHSEYLALFDRAGFDVVEEHPEDVGPRELAALESVPVDESFSGFDPKELAITSAHVVLRKRRSA